jgi:predicted dehydrogenase
MKTSNYSVLIIGCGNIAGQFDMSNSPDQLPCTHAGAFSADKRFSITACLDPVLEKRQAFKDYWKIEKAYSSIEEMLADKQQYDVICLCSPTTNHIHDLNALFKINPKLIFCEKPIAETHEDAQFIVQQCKYRNIRLCINYTRRWDPKIHELAERIESQYYGELRSITAIYNKGIMNNGSHLIDLLHYLLGNLSIEFISSPSNDFFNNDLTMPVLLRSESHIPIQFTIAHAEDYSMAELQFVFSKGILTMEQGGLYWSFRKKTNSERFKDYDVVGPAERIKGDYEHAMTAAVNNIYEALTYNKQLYSDGDSAIKAQQLASFIHKESLKKSSLCN